MNPKFWVKSYPFEKEVRALTDLAKEDIGMEIFFGMQNDVNEEMARICSSSYPRWAVEMFCYKDEHKRKSEIFLDPTSKNPEIREMSKSNLLNALEIADKYNATHLQLPGEGIYDSTSNDDIHNYGGKFLKERIELIKELKGQFKTPIYYENGWPIDNFVLGDGEISAPVFMVVGHNIRNFTEGDMPRELGYVPLEFDVNHTAISLDVYNRANEFGFPLSEQEKGLAEKVRERGITNTVIEEIERIPGEIYFSQVSNTPMFALRGQEPINNKPLLELNRVMPSLVNKSQNINPEVADDDFIARPYLRNCIKALQNRDYEFFKN